MVTYQKARCVCVSVCMSLLSLVSRCTYKSFIHECMDINCYNFSDFVFWFVSCACLKIG